MKRSSKKFWRFFVDYKQLTLVLVAFVIGLGLQIANLQSPAHWILSIGAVIAVLPLVVEMWHTLRGGQYGIDILAIAAIVTSIILGEYWAATVIALMLTGGEALEDYAEDRAHAELNALLKRKPQKAHILIKGKAVDVPVNEVKVGDRLVIYPGEVVPVDGIVVDGSSNLDESSLTGESLPVDKNKGDQLLSGSVNIEGAITVRAIRSAAESQYEQIIKLVRSAVNSQSPFVRLADRYSLPFTVFSFGLAALMWVVTGHAIRFLEVLVVATPCPLLLGAPIALISGMSRASRSGIIVKTGSSLERLANVKTIAFDKTGTLTRGEPVVDEVLTFNKFTKDEVLGLAAALEQKSNHVLATAIVQAADKARLKILKARNIKEQAGHGLSGDVKLKNVTVGRLSLLKNAGIKLPETLKNKAIKQTATYVAINGKLAGVITFKDEVRIDSRIMLGSLKSYGIGHTLMVTGDNRQTAEAIAKELGIEQVEAECLPADKIKAVKSVADKPVAFVGDGVNDAPVLAAADVGIALGARGSTAASESADVVIMLDDINQVANAVSIAKRTFAIGRQSILIGIFISVGLMLIFATGRFRPVYGAAIQELVDVTVIINALRAHYAGPKKHARQLQPTAV